ncbi:MAG: dTDP-4-dehydrorhamnose reductase [Neisseriales bacterium]|nr:MAG: dTDP-4-dehydrorhamnose reductase [Neisseriales bacterium]
MAKILVLGANGQLGSDLMKIFVNTTHEVCGLTQMDLDAASVDAASQLANYTGYDYVINCIATTNVDGCEDNPDLAFVLNSAFVVKLAKFCQEQQSILIQISTDYVLDGTTDKPILETAKPNPLNVYGLSKYAGEIAVNSNCNKYFILRVASLFGIAGAAGKGGNFINTMLRLANEKDSWQVIDDQFSSPTHTLDVAQAICSLIDDKITDFGIYNCVSSTGCSWYEFTREILSLSGLNPDKVKRVSYKDYQFKAKRPQYTILDNSKLAKYHVMPDYKQALEEYLKLKQMINKNERTNA